MIRQGAVTRDARGEAVVGIVMMLMGENSRVVVNKVKQKIEQIEKTLPPGVRIDTFYDRTDLVRGTIKPVFDAMLGEYTASGGDKAWYTIVPKYKPFIYGHLRGKGGSRGYRTTWVDPDTGTRYVAIDMWAGYAALNWRGCVKNPGE